MTPTLLDPTPIHNFFRTTLLKKPVMQRYLVHFAQTHAEFRLPELQALAQLNGIELTHETYYKDRPYLIVLLPSDEQAKNLVERAILVKEILHLWSDAPCLEDLHSDLSSDERLILREPFMEKSFSFKIDSFHRRMTMEEQVQIIESFKYLGFRGPIRLRDPEAYFVCCIHHFAKDPYANHVFFGRRVAEGARELATVYSLKKRAYLGTTSMDSELSLIMANQALVKPGSFVLDPFVGTGSFLVSCSHFGAFTTGMDIDGRQIRGTTGSSASLKSSKNVYSNVKQYGLQRRVMDCLINDIVAHPLRDSPNGWFDAIVTDPPYGVRAGAKKIGILPEDEGSPKTSYLHANGEMKYPKVVPYELDEVLIDLLTFAARFLKVGGRLVFWMPTTQDYHPLDIPSHPCLKPISNSSQQFGNWARRLVTMEKTTQYMGEALEIRKENPAHKNFRDVYFKLNTEDKELVGK